MILTQFGLENFDTGYIPSFSWRVINGNAIYQDFIYKGPPVTIYFHAFFMKILPETGQFFLIRIIVYLLFALQVFFSVSGFYNIYDFSKIKVNRWALMSVCFVVSVLNFSPYPWPTTDGLLFASIAFWLVSKYKNPNFSILFLIAFFTVLSALTKQSFYLIPLFFLFWIFIRDGFMKALFLLLVVVLLLAVYLGWILSITNFKIFLHQTTGETHLYDLYYSGVHSYIFVSIFIFVGIALILIAVIFAYLHYTKQKFNDLCKYFKWFPIFIFTIAILFCLLKQVEIASRIALDASAIAALYMFVFHKKDLNFLTPILVSLGIAWSASISLGYPYPILYGTGIILSFMVFAENNINLNPKQYFWIALPICIVAFSYNLRPYRETNIFKLTYSLESVSPKLKYIKTNRESFEKYTELKHLIEKYGENFIVAPNMPMANYLFNNQSKLQADWIIETEVNRQQKMFIKLAANEKNYIFIEKSFLNHEEFMPTKAKDFSSITWFIYKNFNLIEQTNYFMIYNSLKPNEKLP